MSTLFAQRALCAGATNDPRANIILITVDTLRADHLGCYGDRQARTPVIDGLAAEGIRYAEASAQVPLTLPSHYSILSGTLPIYHGVHDNTAGNADGPPLISQIVKQAGYQTAAFVGSYVLDSSFGLNRGFDTYSDKFDISLVAAGDSGSLQWPAKTVVQRSIAWIAKAHAPFFVWIHFYDLHTPYSPPERFRQQFPQSPYDAEIAYVDSSIGTLLTFLHQQGLSSNTDIILTADHGEGLGDHGEPGHGFFVYESTLHVPLLVYLPRNPPAVKVAERPVQSIDIAPTIARLAGVQNPAPMQGQPLCELGKADCAGVAAPAERWTYFESLYPLREFGWGALRGIKSDRFKYIDAPRPELYDLRTDRNEQQNLFQVRPAVAQEMKQRLDADVLRYAQGPAPALNTLSPEIQKRLAALGYLSGSDGAAHALPQQTLKNPRDELPAYLSIASALESVQAGDSQAAITLMESLLATDPEIAAARFIVGGEYEKQGELLQASEQYRQILQRQPANFLASVNLAMVTAKQGKFDDSVLWYQHALEINPHSSLAHLGLGIALRNQTRWQEAINEFQLSLQPEPNFTALYNLAAIHLLQGEAEPALEAAQSAVPLQPKNWQIFNLLGSIYLSQANLEEAERSYRRALTLNPEAAEPGINLARLLAKTGHPTEARTLARQELKAHPGEPTAQNLLDQLDRAKVAQ